MRRSGSHAILHWIAAQCPGTVHVHLNSCYPAGNPFATCGGDSTWTGCEAATNLAGILSRKDCLTYNYENQWVQDVWSEEMEALRDEHVGASRERYNILLVRSAGNWLASYMRWFYGCQTVPSRKLIHSLVPRWINHAEEALSAAPWCPNKVVIYFDQWAASVEYRRSIANLLGLEFSDAGRQDVSRYGPNAVGDSMDNLTFDGRASEMKVNDRWQRYQSDPIYHSFFTPRMSELDSRLKGEVNSVRSRRRCSCSRNLQRRLVLHGQGHVARLHPGFLGGRLGDRS